MRYDETAELVTFFVSEKILRVAVSVIEMIDMVLDKSVLINGRVGVDTMVETAGDRSREVRLSMRLTSTKVVGCKSVAMNVTVDGGCVSVVDAVVCTTVSAVDVVMPQNVRISFIVVVVMGTDDICSVGEVGELGIDSEV